MSSPKDAGKDKFSRVVRFAQAEADQTLWQTIEKELNEQSQSSFSDLCKQALHQYLADPPAAAPTAPSAEISTLQRQVIALQKQIKALQLQVSKLEGAIGMQQTLALGTLEQQIMQLEQRITQQSHQFTDRLSQIESQTISQTASQTDGTSSAAAEPVEIEMDPLLTRLVPLLEDF